VPKCVVPGGWAFGKVGRNFDRVKGGGGYKKGLKKNMKPIKRNRKRCEVTTEIRTYTAEEFKKLKNGHFVGGSLSCIDEIENRKNSVEGALPLVAGKRKGRPKKLERETLKKRCTRQRNGAGKNVKQQLVRQQKGHRLGE